MCVVVGGEVVVDLWGGLRDRATGAPWCADTMTLVHSTTKGLSGLVLALLHSRGLLDYDERVATYWPEFSRAGKQDITVRQLLAHQAGLFAFDERVDAEVVADLDRLAGVMERQRPIWPPGERQAYHAITLGFYENEIVRRIDPDHRTIGRVLHEDVAIPLGIAGEMYIGTPSSVPDERLAALVPPGWWARLTSMPPRVMIDALWPRSVLHRSLVANPGTGFYVDPEHVIVRELEVPSGGAVATARAIATAYGAFAAAGGPLGLRPADAGGPRRAGDTGTPGLPRRMLPWSSQVLAGFHEAQPDDRLRLRVRLRSARCRRLDGLRRPRSASGIRVRDGQDEHGTAGRPARPRAA